MAAITLGLKPGYTSSPAFQSGTLFISFHPPKNPRRAANNESSLFTACTGLINLMMPVALERLLGSHVVTGLGQEKI